MTGRDRPARQTRQRRAAAAYDAAPELVHYVAAGISRALCGHQTAARVSRDPAAVTCPRCRHYLDSR